MTEQPPITAAQEGVVRSDLLTALRACRLWRTASDEAVADLAQAATVIDAPRGTVIATEGEPAETFGVVIVGKIRVFYLGADGRQITFETLETSQPFAVVAALAGARHPANIEAATPVTYACVPATALFDLLDKEPAVARTLIADLSTRLVNFTAVVSTLALDVPGRVARYVLHQALASGRPTSRGLEVQLGMKKGELAMALGTVPETLSRALAKLKDGGVLDVHGQVVTVYDMRTLASLAGGHEGE